jgi:response regulator RpfG family c-di-GMP phosphodiesterase
MDRNNLCDIHSQKLYKISPTGYFKGIDGRKYFLNGFKVIAETVKKQAMLPVDFFHQSEFNKRKWKEAGYIKTSNLVLKQDGIYAPIVFVNEFDETKLHSFSPSYIVISDKNMEWREVLYLSSVAIVSKPNFPELKIKTERNIMKKKRRKFERNHIKDNIDYLTELNELQKEFDEVKSKYEFELEKAQKEIKELNQRLETLKKEKREKEFDEVIANNPELAPFKPFVINAEEDVFNKWRETMLNNYKDNNLIKSNGGSTHRQSSREAEIEKEIFRQLGLDEEE